MKKRSYLSRITLAAFMTVLLLIVLSTATYAWYSANNLASAGTLVFRSSASDVGGVLTIGKNKTSQEYEMSFDLTSDIQPMIPTADGVVGQTKLPGFVSFQKTYEGINDLGKPVAMLDGTAATPLMLSVDGQKYFYLNNISPDYDVTVNLDYTVLGTLKDKLHIAVFVGDRETDAVLMGIISGSGVIHYGAIRVGEFVDEKPTMQTAYKMTGEIRLTVPKGGSLCLRLVAWLDGVDMKNTDGDKTTSFSLAFKGE